MAQIKPRTLSGFMELLAPAGRYGALHRNAITFPSRRFQIGKGYRGERAQKGRYREV